MNQLEPFTLSLSKRRAGLRQAQPERIFQVQRCRLNNAQAEHVRLLDVQLLSNDWYVLRKVTFELRRREAEEETGYRIRAPRKVFEAYMSPGSVTEKLHFFVADYEAADRIQAGGGLASEGEDIEVVEMALSEALAGIRAGTIEDGKTIMLLQHVALEALQGSKSK